jgi:hypothetical protein
MDTALLPSIAVLPKQILLGWENKSQAFLNHGYSGSLDNQSGVDELHKLVREFQEELFSHDVYHAAVESASRFIPGNYRNWGWHPLIELSLLRIGLISTYRTVPIQLHDNPNSWGVQQVISGNIRVQQYQQSREIKQASTLISLEQVSDVTLTEGQQAIFTPSYCNLQKYESETDCSVILSILINPYHEQERSWYYLMPFTSNGNRGLYSRIGK